GMKSVLSLRIDFINVGLVVFLHRLFGAWNALVDGGIFFSIMCKHRRLNVLHQIQRLRAAAIENHRGLESANLCRCCECHLAAPAKANESQPVPPNVWKSSHEGEARVRVFRDTVPGNEIADFAWRSACRVYFFRPAVP